MGCEQLTFDIDVNVICQWSRDDNEEEIVYVANMSTMMNYTNLSIEEDEAVDQNIEEHVVEGEYDEIEEEDDDFTTGMQTLKLNQLKMKLKQSL